MTGLDQRSSHPVPKCPTAAKQWLERTLWMKPSQLTVICKQVVKKGGSIYLVSSALIYKCSFFPLKWNLINVPLSWSGFFFVISAFCTETLLCGQFGIAFLQFQLSSPSAFPNRVLSYVPIALAGALSFKRLYTSGCSQTLWPMCRDTGVRHSTQGAREESWCSPRLNQVLQQGAWVHQKHINGEGETGDIYNITLYVFKNSY